MKKISFLIIGFFIASSCMAQTVKSYVITSAGSAVMSADGALYLSIGEPMNTEVSGGEIMISQGFLNVTIAGIVSDTDVLLSEVIKAYPNPVGTHVTIDMPEMNGTYFYELYDLTGQVIKKEGLNSSKQSVDFSDLNAGSYFMKVVKDNKSSKTLKINKI